MFGEDWTFLYALTTPFVDLAVKYEYPTVAWYCPKSNWDTELGRGYRQVLRLGPPK